MLTIAAFTFREAMRRRLVAVAVLITAAFLLLLGLGLHAEVTSGSPAVGLLGGLTLVLVGLYLASPLPALLAVLATAGAISAEVENGAVQAVLARPIGRGDLVLGKFVGLALLLLAYTACLYAAVLLIAWAIAGATLPRPAAVLALLLLQPLVLVALTLFGSTFLPTMANGAAAILLYGLSSFGGAIEQLGAFSGVHALGDIGAISTLVLPSDAIYRRAAGLAAAQGGASSMLWQMAGPAAGVATPGPGVVVYAVAYVLVAVAAAVWVFTRRDV
ncbi:MAG TPA: ABC transporter permease subunit [Bacillota bacterium]|nr:ABC transporter permease subunit [Bacillota bacterium]